MSTKKKESILEAANGLFDKFGIRRVSMEEISKQVSMSKKTLYKFFLSKEDLVESLMDFKMNTIKKRITRIVDDESVSFEEKLKLIFKFMNENLKSFQISFVHEIQQNHKKLWEKIQNFKSESIHSQFAKLLNEGYGKGYIRQDIDPKILVDMYSSTLQTIMVPSYILSTEYSNTEIYNMIIKIYFQGILTEKANKEFVLFES